MTSKEKKKLLDEIAGYKKEIELYKEKQNALELLMEETATAIIIGTNKGNIIMANKKTLEISKYSLHEILQLKVNDLIISDTVPISFSRKNYKEPATEFSSEHIMVRHDGKRIFVSTRTKLLPDKNYQIIINDINKRKKAELALIESEKRYRILAENIHEVVWTSSVRLKTIFISASIVNITGFAPEVYYLKPLSELVTPISFQLIRDTMRKERGIIKTGISTLNKYSKTIEIKLLHKKSNSVWVEVTSTVIQNQFGEIVGFQGVLRNIDSHKKTLEILDKNQLKYNFALKSTGSGVWELNADLTKINIDENLINLLGYSSKEIKPFLNDWISLTYKNDRLSVIDYLQDLLDGKKMTMSYECRRIHKEGKIMWFKDYVQALTNEDGSIKGLLGTSKNITNEKITEEKKFRYFAGLQMLINSTFHFLKLNEIEEIYDYTGQVLLQNIPNSILVFSEINAVTKEAKPFKYYGINNPLFEKLFNDLSFHPYLSSVILNNHLFTLLEKEMLIEIEGGFNKFIKSIFAEEERKKISDNLNLHNVHVMGSQSGDSLVNCIVIISREKGVFQNKEFIEAFISLSSIIINKKKTEIELKNLNATKDKFFSIISHDLKNPFNTFIGFSGLIIQNIEKISREKILEFSKVMHDSALQSYEMMQNLFEWVVSQKKGIELKPALINAKGLINSNLNLFSGEAFKKGISLKLITSDELDFFADIDMLNTIFRNLISNAIKFTKKDGTINISFRKDENLVEFTIDDNGIGISEDDQKRIFNIDTNKSTIGTGNEKGTGLGLILCREFVEIHNGRIWVESKQGKGSSFKFYIPLNLNIKKDNDAIFRN